MTCVNHLGIPTGPVVTSTSAVLREVDVLGVVQVCIRRIENGVDDARLQIQQYSARDVVLIISLKKL